jgi:glycine cleavage system H protein
VNQQPYADGWLIFVDPADPSQIEALLDAEAYRSFVEDGT